MAVICPSVLAKDPHAFREQMERVGSFAHRIQIDLTDGVFAPSHTINLDHVWWPEGVQADLHLMYQQPEEYLDQIIGLKPHLVIVHAEAEGNFMRIADTLRQHHIKSGVALLPKSHPKVIEPALKVVDHVLIFGGRLGYYGGEANLQLAEKAKFLRKYKLDFEIGWDGGVNLANAHYLASHGIDVLNVGGFIQNSDVPQEAYAKLETAIKGA